MKTATVGEIQKNFARILRNVRTGEEVTVTRRGRPVAKITALGPREKIDWPDFYREAITLEGKQVSQILQETREERL